MSFGDFPIDNKIVVITGGGSGIGLAFAKLAHEKGAKVIIGDISLRPEAKELVEKGAVFERCDVTKWDDMENLVKVSEKRFGDVPDVYHANAGVLDPEWSSFWLNTEKERCASMDIMAVHPIKLTRIAMKALLGKNKKGGVCITASVAGYTPIYPLPLYSASKHAVIGFTRSMTEAAQVQGVKVVAICPALVDTPMWTENPEAMDRFNHQSGKNTITQEEVAAAIRMIIEEDKYGGGTCLEVSKMGTRLVPFIVLEGEGTQVPEEAVRKTLAPILAVTNAERGIVTA